MKDVTFVISGYQNPLRGEIRSKAISMGAKYKGDWDDSCTHLICAFSNTPKYNQVKASKNGKRIVNKDWIENCEKDKKKYPWRRFALDPKNKIHESEDEIWDDSLKPESSSYEDTDEEIETIKKRDTLGEDNLNDIYTRDTDDELDKNLKTIINDPKYIEETDDEENEPIDTSALKYPPLPNYFQKDIFYFYGFIDDNLSNEIIIAGGIVKPYRNQDVKIIVTDKPWDINFDNALRDNPDLVFIKPSYVRQCVKMKKKVDMRPYLVTKK